MIDEKQKELVAEVAKLLPESYIRALSEALIAKALDSVNWNRDEIVNKLVLEAVVDRAKEILKTQYAERVEKEAQLLAARLVQEIPRLTFETKRTY